MKKFVILAYNTNEKAKVIEVCNNKEEAEAFVQNDIEEYVDQNSLSIQTCDFNDMTATHFCGKTRNWSIECISI